MQRGTPTTDRIGTYRVLTQLSVMGPVQVHLAREEGPGGFSRNVVLKIVPNAPGVEADSRQLVADATACAKLTHPCIVRTRQVFEHEGALVLALEHLDGASLADLLSSRMLDGERPFSDDAALYIGVSICDALAHAHAALDEKRVRAPVVHRAVSPSHVLIGRDGFVKLDGFGFAKILGGVATDSADGPAWTPAYMAPEQITDQQPTPKVDVYAAGLILWELLTGRSATVLPRDPLAIEATFKAVAERKLESLATLRPDLPAELTAAVDSALIAAPDKRVITCAELARPIRKVCRVATGKTELRERVEAALSTAASDRRQSAAHAAISERRQPASASASHTKATASELAPPRASSQRHRTLVGVAPPSANASARERLLAPAAESSISGLPIVSIGQATPPPPPVIRDSSRDIETAMATSTPPVVISAPPPLPPSSRSKLELAATVAMQMPAAAPPLPADLLVDATESEASAATEEHLFAPIPVPHFPEPMNALAPVAALEPNDAPPRDDVSTGVWQWSSFVSKLRAPTPWRRSPWLIAWVSLSLSLVAVVAKISLSRPRGPSNTSVLASAPVPARGNEERMAAATVPSLPATAPSLPAEAPLPPEVTKGNETEAVAAPTIVPRGLGQLTVHSTAARANVYVDLRPYGSLEETLSVPCGKRFISIGIPARRPAKPVWLAPGKMMMIPCGAAYEMTMNPRPLR